MRCLQPTGILLWHDDTFCNSLSIPDVCVVQTTIAQEESPQTETSIKTPDGASRVIKDYVIMVEMKIRFTALLSIAVSSTMDFQI